MNLINKKIPREHIANPTTSTVELNKDELTQKYFISDQDFLNISMLELKFEAFNTYIKSEEQDESNLLYQFNKKIIIQFLKDKTIYKKNFIL